MSAIGVDFGYSSVRVTRFKDGNEDEVSTVDIIENDLASRCTPTVVAFDESTRLIGVEAMNHAALYPEHAVLELKRLIGLRFDCLDGCLQNCYFDYANCDGRLMIRLPVSNDATKLFTTEQLLATIFAKIKEYAESEQIYFEKVVVSVPTYFSQTQRLAVIASAAIADIEVEALINDTTAVAVNYVWDKLEERYNGNCLLFVFSFGASSLEVALIEAINFELQVLSTSGSLSLGGVDFDNRLIGLCIEKFEEQYNIDVREQNRLMHKLRIQCQKAKVTLQTRSDVRVKIDTPDNNDLVTVIKKEEFENECQDLFNSAMNCVENVFKGMNWRKEEVNEVILVGGCSRLRRIENSITRYFNGKRINRRLNVDEAVVNGAAIYAAKLSGVNDEKVNILRIENETNGHSSQVITEAYASLSNEEIEEFKHELNSYKQNCATEDEKVKLKNEIQSEFFKLKQFLQRIRAQLIIEDCEYIESEINSMNDRIDFVDTSIDCLNELRNEVEQKREIVDHCLTKVDKEKCKIREDMFVVITRFDELATEAKLRINHEQIQQLEYKVSAILSWVNSTDEKTIHELFNEYQNLINIEAFLKKLLKQENSQREQHKCNFLIHLKSTASTVFSEYNHLKSFNDRIEVFVKKMREIKSKIVNIPYPSQLLINELHQEMEGIIEKFRSDFCDEENERVETKEKLCNNLLDIEGVLNDSLKSKSLMNLNEMREEVAKVRIWLNENPLADVDELNTVINSLSVYMDTIQLSLKRENDRIAVKNELHSEILTFWNTYLTPLRQELYKIHQLDRMVAEINSISQWLEYNPLATQADFERKREELAVLTKYGQRKLKQISENETLFVGIDVGTTYCRVSVFSDGSCKTVKDWTIDFTLPSFVAVADNVLIGAEAKQQYSFNPKNTIYNIKKLMGCKKDENFYKEIENLSYVVDDSLEKVKIRINNKFVYYPEELTAMLLIKLKCLIEQHFDKEVNSVAISVPVNFCNSQRQATFDAALIAGFKNVRLVNDTIAASLKNLWEESRLLNQTKLERKNVLVVSIGAAYTSVSVLQVNDESIETKSHSGKTIGGMDFDKCLLLRVHKKALKYRKFNKEELNDLLLQCEQCKIALSSKTEANITIEEINGSLRRVLTISRETFEKICKELFDTIFQCISDTLVNAKIQRPEINEVLLVGGTTQMPKIRKFFDYYFQKSYRTFFSNGSIASGSAIYSAVMSKRDSMKIAIRDVTPFEYSFDSFNNNALIIKRNSQIPVKHKGSMRGCFDYQINQTFKVYELRDKCKTLIADPSLKSVHFFHKNEIAFNIEVELDSNGLLLLSAIENCKGSKRKELFVKSRLSNEELQTSNTEVQKIRLRLLDEVRLMSAKYQLKCTLRNYSKELNELGDSMHPVERRQAKELIQYASLAIENDKDDQEYYASRKRDVEICFKKLLRKQSNPVFYAQL